MSPARLITSIALTLTFAVSTANGQKMYWTNMFAHKIQRAHLDGSNVEDLVVMDGTGPTGLALDLTGGKLYWTDIITRRIRRADLDGSNIEQLYTTQVFLPYAIAIDSDEGKMYWAEAHEAIRRANLDGSIVEDVITDEVGQIGQSLALDLDADMVFWADVGAYEIRRADFTGAGLETVVSTDDNGALGIAIDSEGGNVYWTQGMGERRITRAILDGSNIEELITVQLEFPIGIALDVRGGKIYWADYLAGKIQRANIEIPPGDAPDRRSDIEDLVTGLNRPVGVALDLTCPVSGDGNADSEVDLADVGAMQRCFTGAIGPVMPFAYASSCRCLDADEDGDFVLGDYAAFLDAMIAEPVP